MVSSNNCLVGIGHMKSYAMSHIHNVIGCINRSWSFILICILQASMVGNNEYSYFGFERTWWMLQQELVVRTKFDIYVFNIRKTVSWKESFWQQFHQNQQNNNYLNCSTPWRPRYWKSRSWVVMGIKCGGIKPVYLLCFQHL